MADLALGVNASRLMDMILGAKIAEVVKSIYVLVNRSLWNNNISESEHEYLDKAIIMWKAPNAGQQVTGQYTSPTIPTRDKRLFFTRGKRHKSPDRQASIERRRTLGGSSKLHPEIRKDFTMSEQSVLTIISIQIQNHGYCDLSVGEIAARAGVSHTTAQNTLRKADVLKSDSGCILIKKRAVWGAKNLTNVITITLKKWTEWLSRIKDVFVDTRTDVDTLSTRVDKLSTHVIGLKNLPRLPGKVSATKIKVLE
jgi:hypothetical protein